MLLAVLCLFVSLILGFKLWDAFANLIAVAQVFKLDEIVLPLALIMLGIVVDALRTLIERRAEKEKVSVYNHMNQEIMEEISSHLTKLLEFRTTLMKDGAQSQDVGIELDRMIVRSYNHYERVQKRGDIDSRLMPLALSDFHGDLGKTG